jgi:hypothetical protein
MSDRGQGRKPISPTGEVMKPRQIRMTDAQWEDAQFITMDEVRRLIVKEAKRLRSASSRIAGQEKKENT